MKRAFKVAFKPKEHDYASLPTAGRFHVSILKK